MNKENTSIKKDSNQSTIQNDSRKRVEVLLAALIDDNTSAEIKEIISDWFKSEASEEDKYAALENVIDDLTPNHKPSKKDYDNLAKLHEKLGFPKPQHKWTERISLRKVAVRVAAVLIPTLFLLGGAYFWIKGGEDSEGNTNNILATEIIVSASDGINKQVVLADNSQVRVSKGSSVGYSENFEQEREVYLKGEAFFNVTKVGSAADAKPFSVKTDHVTITVLGTEFKVTEYPESENTLVSLYSGKIEVLAGGNVTQMIPGECFEYNHTTHEILTTSISVDQMLSEGYVPLLRFRDATLEQIIRSVEENYDVVFEKPLGAALNQGSFSADFDGESLNSILELLTLLDDKFTYKQQGDKVIMSNK